MYIGNFSEGKFHGKGDMKVYNKLLIMGHFIKGKISSAHHTIINYENGDQYKGTVNGMKPDGEGEYYIAKENITVKGSFRKGQAWNIKKKFNSFKTTL